MNTLLTQVLSEAAPYVVAAVVGILIMVIKKVGDAVIEKVVEVLPHVQKLLEQKLGVEKTKQLESQAWKVWQQVDEHFRITEFVGDVIKAKQDMFDKLLLEKVPGLTQKQVEDLRQAIAGEVNKGKEKIVTPAAVTIDSQQLQELQVKAQKFDQLQTALQASETSVNQA